MPQPNGTPEPQPDGKSPEANTPGGNDKGETPRTFSQDEVNDMISSRVNELNAKSEEKIAKAVKEALAERERQEKMSAEDKAREEQEKRNAELADKERSLKLRENRADAREILQEKSIPDTFVDYLVSEDMEETKGNIDKFAKVWSDAVSAEVDKRVAGKTPEDPSSKPQPPVDGKKTTHDLLFGKKG